MAFLWKKLGRIFDPTKNINHPKLLTHSANPLPIHLRGDIFRIFYSARDVYNRSSVGAVDIDIMRKNVVTDHKAPVFEYDPKSNYYSHGVSIGNHYEVSGIKYILFMGWQNPSDGHWRGDIGRLILGSDMSLKLDGKNPFMGNDPLDEISLSYPWVLPNPKGGFHMWYGSTKTWDAGNGEMLHVINYADSKDGHKWERKGLAVPFCIGKAQAFSRPTVIFNAESGYQMWFSYRSGSGTKYRIGYASSEDGFSWQLENDKAGIDVAAHGWDSDMIEYPYVFAHNNQLYMLYNGNGYGESGIGLAILNSD